MRYEIIDIGLYKEVEFFYDQIFRNENAEYGIVNLPYLGFEFHFQV